jgi:guanylate kinase
MEALLERLRDRKTEDPDVLMRRFETASHELERAHDFDYVVFNEAGKLDEALDNIVAIIEAEQRRVDQPKITIE